MRCCGDRVVLGIRDDGVRKKLISQGNTLSLELAVRLCRNSEVTTPARKSMATGTAVSTVAAVSKQLKRSIKGQARPQCTS